MKRKIDSLKQLEKIAKVKSDLEMRRLSAFRANVVAAQNRIDSLHAELQKLYASPAPFTIAEARLANALAKDRIAEIRIEEANLARMMPAFEAARCKAVKEFGRADVLQRLRNNLKDAQEKTIQRKSE